MDKYINNDGISNTIGTILLVGLVVALVALVVLFVFNFAGEQSEGPGTASVDFTATSDGVEVTVLDKGNVDEFLVEVDGTNLATLNEVGASETITAEGQYNIIGRLNDGSETVINSKIISGTLEGLFTVFQDQEDGTVEAQLVKQYSEDDEYELVTNTTTSDGSTASKSIEKAREKQLLGSGELLQSDNSNGISIAEFVAKGGGDGDEIGDNREPVAQVGERVKVHKILSSWCEGDTIELQSKNSDKMLESEEFSFDHNCGNVTAVPKYNANGELTAVKIINTWFQQADYSMFAYRGEVEPPKLNVIEAGEGDFSMSVEVFEGDDSTNNINTSSPVSGSEVAVGNLEGSTDSSGNYTLDRKVPGEEPYFVTVNADGYQSTQVPFRVLENDDGTYKKIKMGVAGSGSDLSSVDTDSAVRSPAYGDDGLYAVVDNSGDNPVINVGVADSDPKTTVQPRETYSVSSGNTKTVDVSTGNWFDSSGSSSYSGWNVAFSSGGGGGGGGGSYDAGSGGSGSTIYSGSGGTKTTTTLSASTTNIASSSDATITSPTPTRELDLGKLNRSDIPTGEVVKISSSITSYSTEPSTDHLRIWRAKKGSNTDMNIIMNESINLPAVSSEGNSETVSKVIDLKLNSDNKTDTSLDPREAGKFTAGNEYTLYASLKSNGNIKEAGTLDVFDEELTKSQLDITAETSISSGSTSDNTPSNSDGRLLDTQVSGTDLSEVTVGDTITITLKDVVKGSNSNSDPANNGSNGETVDIYKNGELVKRVKGYEGSSDIVYTETLNNAKYIDYHVGLKEATETALIDTAVVNDVTAIEDSETYSGVTFDPQISIVKDTSKYKKYNGTGDNSYDCTSQTASNYNCEIEANSNAKLTFKLSDSTFDATEGSLSAVSIDQFKLNIGDEKVLYNNNSGGSDPVRPDGNGVGYYNMTASNLFSEDRPYLVEYSATLMVDGEAITATDTTVINAYTSTGEITSYIGTPITSFAGGEGFDIPIETERSGIDETIDVKIETDNSESGVSDGSYIEETEFISKGGTSQEISVRVSDITDGTGFSISDITNDAGDIPLIVKIKPTSSSGDTLDAGTDHEAEFKLKPDGTITKTDIDASVSITESP